MKALIEINCDNAAFFSDHSGQPDVGRELCIILKELANLLSGYSTFTPDDSFGLYDSNGNLVGQLTFSEAG